MKKEEEMTELVQLNSQTELALDIICHTGTNLFLTGKAGTGKTTFLKYLKTNCTKRMIVVAPTGVAAMNAGGVTIHSFFQIPFGPYCPGVKQEGTDAKFFKLGKEKKQIIRSLDLLVIDEVSMVRADLLDAVSDVLKFQRHNNQPFGGVQLLLIGDLQQLAPVIKDNEWALLEAQYASPFFFDSHDLKASSYWQIELKQVYRQTDLEFIDILNRIRENKLDTATIERLNQRYLPHFQPAETDNYITLTTHNHTAQLLNNEKLDKIPWRSYSFKAEINGDFPEYNYPTEETLTLKQEAQVMFIKNDSSGEKRYYNGKIGRVASVNVGEITVVDEDGNEIKVERETWENTKYSLNPETKAIEESTAGTFKQYPLKLAWAITIHKSQGLTFDRAIIDAAASFSHGQVYVALSRCRTLEGIVLTSPLSPQAMITDNRIEQYTKQIACHQPSQNQLLEEQKHYYQSLLVELFDFKDLQQQMQRIAYLTYQFMNKLYPDFTRLCALNRDRMKTEVTDIGWKFCKQIDQMMAQSTDYAHDEALQDRVRKGCPYFLGKLKEICEPVLKIEDMELDNKENKKQIDNATERLKEELKYKQLTLKANQDGFSIEKYLTAKARVNIDLLESKKERNRSSRKTDTIEKADVPTGILHPDLYDKLRDWRWKMAQEKKLPTYTILQQKALIGIANLIPTNERTLLSIPGIGKRVVLNYGEELLQIVNEWKEKA